MTAPATLPVIMLAGPTASGKTRLSLELAQQLPVEIISVDSAQIYRGMDIGSAKPNAQERAQIPHHLIDILDPREVYSAARFAADARKLIAQVRARGRMPLLVGGTMLYFRALHEGLSELPSADPALRARLEDEARAHGVSVLHERLAKIDPPTAARLHVNDQQRVQRALEIYELTGTPPSAWFARPRTGVIDGPVVRVALESVDRALLHRRIERRFDEMMSAGFLDEVRSLYQRGDLSVELPSMRAVGYRQLWAHLQDAVPLAEAIERGKAATRQYAKRQMTWLRGDATFHRLDPTAADAVSRLETLITLDA